MASTLLRLTRSVIPFRPPSPIHLPTIHNNTRQHSVNTSQTRPFSSPPKRPTFEFDLRFLAYQMETMPGVPSMLLTLVNGEELTVHIPGMEKLDTDDGPCVILQMPGLRVPKGEYQAVAHDTVVEDDTMLTSFKTSKETYLAGVKLPESVAPVGRMNVSISKGMVKLTFPYLKNTDFAHTPVKLARPTPYCGNYCPSNILGRTGNRFGQVWVGSWNGFGSEWILGKHGLV